MRTVDHEHFLTEDEVVARYRKAITAGTLRNWRSKGQGPPYIHIGKAVLYARRDLEAWEGTHRIAPSIRPSCDAPASCRIGSAQNDTP